MRNSNISITTKLEVFSIIDECLNIDNKDEFKVVLNKTQQLFGQEMAAFGVGNVRAKTVVSTVNIGFSSDFMGAIVNNSGQMMSPLFHRWVMARTPQIVNFKDNPRRMTFNGISPYHDFSVKNIMSHGLVDVDQKCATYFGFAQIPEAIGNRHTRLMEILAPHLHVAYTRLPAIRKKIGSFDELVIAKPVQGSDAWPRIITTANSDARLLTPRELEVLKRLFEGKSNWDIGDIMNISEFTVKNHVQKVMRKLKASSRQHAVAIGLKKGLIVLS